MALDVASIMQQLRDNKKSPHKQMSAPDSKGMHLPILATPREPKKFHSKQLGKLVGCCPKCQIMLGSLETAYQEQAVAGVTKYCTRCGVELPPTEDLPQEVSVERTMEWRRLAAWGDHSMPAKEEATWMQEAHKFMLS